jgi:hypothetical protein
MQSSFHTLAGQTAKQRAILQAQATLAYTPKSSFSNGINKVSFTTYVLKYNTL